MASEPFWTLEGIGSNRDTQMARSIQFFASLAQLCEPSARDRDMGWPLAAAAAAADGRNYSTETSFKQQQQQQFHSISTLYFILITFRYVTFRFDVTTRSNSQLPLSDSTQGQDRNRFEQISKLCEDVSSHSCHKLGLVSRNLRRLRPGIGSGSISDDSAPKEKESRKNSNLETRHSKIF